MNLSQVVNQPKVSTTILLGGQGSTDWNVHELTSEIVGLAWTVGHGIRGGSHGREDFEDGTANKEIYKISQCVTSALMMQIAEYCTCYLSYITDIHRYVNSTGLSGIGFTILLSDRHF